MGSFLSREQLSLLAGAETLPFSGPVPTRMISNGEFTPVPQTEEQRRVEALLNQWAEARGHALGMDRRRFLKTSAGMAAAFWAMNQVFGPVFQVAHAEAADPDAAAEAARAFKDQFVFDAQVHFIRDEVEPGNPVYDMLGIRRFAGQVLNKDLSKAPIEISDLKFQNFVKEIFFDSDTHMGILSGAPSDDLAEWFLTNDQMALARQVVNEASGSKRLLAHSIITPGQPGWLEEMDRCIETVKPDSWKGYTVGNPNHPSDYRWRLDDEKLLYPAYEKMMQSGIRNICIHKGLLPAGADAEARAHAGVDDVGKAARDWPEINFIIYHAAYNVLMPTADHMKRLEEEAYVEWVSDLAAIPETFDVSNVYAEIGSSFGIAAVMQPQFCAAMLGTLIRSMGAENVFWGTDSVWYGSPQWQIEAFRRIEIPEDMQKKHGFAPLGPADGPVKAGILGLNSARHYGLDVPALQKTFSQDTLAQAKAEYQAAGEDRSNLAYGFVDNRKI